MKVIVKDNQNLIDLAIQYYGSIEGLSQLMTDNPSLTLGGVIDKGAELIIDKSKVVDKSVFEVSDNQEVIIGTGSQAPDFEGYVPPVIPIGSGQAVQPPSLAIKIKDNQNIIDLAIQFYGGVEGIAFLKQDNPGLSIDGLLEKGTVLVVDTAKVVNKQVLEYIERRKLVVATGSSNDYIGNFWVTENEDFVIDEDNNFALY